MSVKQNINGTLVNIAGAGATNAANVAYDNTDSGLVASNAQGAIDELKSSLTDLECNKAGTIVNIASYNSSSNKYIIPSNGYVKISYEAGPVTAAITDSTGSVIGPFSCLTQYQSAMVYVKKGMQVYITQNTNGNVTAFVPMES